MLHEPLFEHRSRPADLAADLDAREQAAAGRLADPRDLYVQQAGRGFDVE